MQNKMDVMKYKEIDYVIRRAAHKKLNYKFNYRLKEHGAYKDYLRYRLYLTKAIRRNNDSLAR